VSWREGRCFLGDIPNWKIVSSGASRRSLAPECLALAKDRKNYLVLGDSHAAALWIGLQATFKDVNFLQATVVGCRPTVIHLSSDSAMCTHLIDDVLQNFLSQVRVDGVLLVGHWDGALVPVAATLAWMKKRQIRVMLFGPSVEYDSPFPQLLVSAARAADATLLERHLVAGTRELDAEMSRLATAQGVPYVSLRDLQCDIPSCAPGGFPPILFDNDHYTPEGSRLIARRLRDIAKIRW
jgi:hypothetical protein